MSDTRAILEDSINRMLTEHVTPQLLRRVEAGEWPEKLWTELKKLGVTDVFAGGSDDPWRDACVIIKACGRHALPAPLAEHLVATSVLTNARADLPEGPISLSDGVASDGRSKIAWARYAKHAVIDSESKITLADLSGADIRRNEAVSREPRDEVKLSSLGRSISPQANAKAPSVKVAGAMMRAAQMAGAIERVLALTAQYAKDRVQFGKPIGAYQAIQQQLAVLAGQSAAATRAVDAAFETAARGDDLFFDAAVAKVRAGEAAGHAASISHQVHGAIGFTDEHVLHYFTRRLWTWRAEFGSESHWAHRLGAYALADIGPEGLWPAVTNAG